MSPIDMVIGVLCIAFALLIHEFAHAWMSYQLGDPTAKYEGRLTLNPIVHFEPIGFICLTATYITSGGTAIMGWAKPVPIDSGNFKNRTLDIALVAAAGPFINLFAAFLLSMLVLTGLVLNTPIFPVIRTLIVANVGFAIFNLIPWPPLDGWKIAGAVMGETISGKMQALEAKLGLWSLVGLLIILTFFGKLVLYPINHAVLSIFLGGS
jgi:Zn-dependent protease